MMPVPNNNGNSATSSTDLILTRCIAALEQQKAEFAKTRLDEEVARNTATASKREGSDS